MNLYINKTLNLNGVITPPSSKSQSIRAIMLSALADGESCLTNILNSADTQDAIQVCTSLGANIIESQSNLIVKSNGLPLQIQHQEIDSGNSGITTHFVMPILGLRKNTQQSIILNCSDQMRQRPIKPLVDALNNLGLKIEYLGNESVLPIKISGVLTGGKTSVDGVTSQYLSALLMALPLATSDSEIKVANLQERPYVEMTLRYLSMQGIQLTHSRMNHIDTYSIIGRQQYKPFNMAMSGDFSSASYIIAAAALIPGKIILHGLDIFDEQGDKKLLTLLKTMGADVQVTPHTITISGGKELSGITINAEDIPDLLPSLAVIATQAISATKIHQAAHARIKETDRIHSMTEGLRRLGAKITEHEDGLTIYPSKLVGNSVKGYNDHRTVMALSIAGMLAEGKTLIDDGLAINKTFPTFVKLMQSIGANIEVHHATAN